jgi:intraflagellar transport protein 56
LLLSGAINGRSSRSIFGQAFDVLERLDPNPEYLEGKKGACVGTFQAVIAETEKDKDVLRDVIAMLRKSANSNPQVESMTRIMVKWAKEKGIPVS